MIEPATPVNQLFQWFCINCSDAWRDAAAPDALARTTSRKQIPIDEKACFTAADAGVTVVPVTPSECTENRASPDDDMEPSTRSYSNAGLAFTTAATIAFTPAAL